MENIQKKQTFWDKFAKKNNVSSYEIAKNSNIPEEKVKEILKGERDLPSDKVDLFTKSIKCNNKTNLNIKRNEALMFFAEHKPKALRKYFNYNKQRDLAKELGISQFTVSRFENPNFGPKSLSTTTLCKFYDFYKDELNIKLDNEKAVNKDDTTKLETIYSDISDYKDLEYYKDYFKDINIRYAIKNKYGTMRNFMRKTGIDSSTMYKYLRGSIDLSLNMYERLYSALVLDKVIPSNLSIAKNCKKETVKEITSKKPGTNKAIISTRIDKYQNYYDEEKECAIKSTINTYKLNTSIFSKYTPEDLFKYLINNCAIKDVVDLYKLLDKYFKDLLK